MVKRVLVLFWRIFVNTIPSEIIALLSVAVLNVYS
jgi:hypothetical protein